jgi:cyclin-dependent kinase
MSTVFKARDKSWIAPDRIVALKVTHPASMTPPHDSKREARLLSECHHAAVVPLLESFNEPGGRFVMAFPFLHQDLENLLRTGRLSSQQKRLVFRGMFEALAHIHSLGIIHRDIKPSNILLKGMDGPVYLADFGIAWSPRDTASEPTNSKITDVGTTSYRPPELLFGHSAYDASLDMWAAGCVVGELERQGHYSIFDGGPLGSELGLIKSMFTTLGTPTDETWPVSHTSTSVEVTDSYSRPQPTQTGTR